jgi:hypothetical protein
MSNWVEKQVEDLVAQVLCTADQPQDAISHCQTSIQVRWRSKTHVSSHKVPIV